MRSPRTPHYDLTRRRRFPQRVVAIGGQTRANGLTYNLRVGTIPGGSDIVSPQSSSAGFRRLPAMGNAQHGITAVLTNLPVGTYFWSVQAVDTAFAGSPFATEGRFTVGPPAVETLEATGIAASGATLQGTVNPNGQTTMARFEWGATTSYGNTTTMTNLGSGTIAIPLTFDLTGLDAGSTWHYRVAASNTLGVVRGADRAFTTPVPPSIVWAVPTQTVEAGTTAMLKVQASGSEPLSYQWFLEGTNAIPGANQAALHLTNLQSSHFAIYTVVISNSGGSVTSAPAMLAVIPPVERRLVPAITISGQPGSTADLDCADSVEAIPLWRTMETVLLETPRGSASI